MRSLKRFFTFRQGKVSARRYAKEQARLRAGLERGLEKSLVRMFNRRLKAVTDALKAELIPDLDVTAVPLAEEMAGVLNDRIRRTFRTVYDYNNDRYKDLNTKGEVSFGFGFGNNAEYDSYISSYLQGRQSYITNISQRMGRSIVGDINSLREEGLTLPQISREISAKYRRINRSRATTIARTETHSATGAAHDNYHRQVASSYGVLMKKQWVATSDARTRGAHAAMNGVTVEMDETFKMPNGTEMNYVGDTAGGPSNVVNCRCVILYVDTEDELPKENEFERVYGTDIDPMYALNDLESGELLDIAADPLKYITARQGYAGKPKIVSKKEYDALGSDEMWRGVQGSRTVSAKERIDALKTGKFFLGRGIYGNGTYAAIARGGPVKVADAKDTAFAYANDIPSGVTSFKLAPDAKTITYDKITRQMEIDYDELMKKSRRANLPLVGDESWAVGSPKYTALYKILTDEGHYAAFRGYDAIIKEFGRSTEADYLVLLNRTAMVFEE